MHSKHRQTVVYDIPHLTDVTDDLKNGFTTFIVSSNLTLIAGREKGKPAASTFSKFISLCMMRSQQPILVFTNLCLKFLGIHVVRHISEQCLYSCCYDSCVSR